MNPVAPVKFRVLACRGYEGTSASGGIMADDTMHHFGDPALSDALQRFERAEAELDETEQRRPHLVECDTVSHRDAAWLPDGPSWRGRDR